MLWGVIMSTVYAGCRLVGNNRHLFQVSIAGKQAILTVRKIRRDVPVTLCYSSRCGVSRSGECVDLGADWLEEP